MKTVRKNQKRVRDLFEKENIKCKCYSLEDNFEPAEVSKEVVKKRLYEFKNAKLIENVEGVSYTVQIHSNLWYTIVVDK